MRYVSLLLLIAACTIYGNLNRGVNATVVIEGTIGIDGSITNARVIQGDPRFEDAALPAFRQWKFTPAIIDGKEVPAQWTETFQVSLP